MKQHYFIIKAYQPLSSKELEKILKEVLGIPGVKGAFYYHEEESFYVRVYCSEEDLIPLYQKSMYITNGDLITPTEYPGPLAKQ